MATRTVKVTNLSLGAMDHDIKEFFSFCDDIQHVDLQSENERSQIAFVTFQSAEGAETAILLSGATIVDQPVTIEAALDYTPPAVATDTSNVESGGESVVQKAEYVVSSVLSRGFSLGKDALNKAKSFDNKHQLSSTASATVASLDQKIGVSEKFSAGTTLVNDKMKEMDQKFQVSEKTKSAYAAAGQTVSGAGSAVMKNRYILTGATWVTGAFSRVTKAAGDLSPKPTEKVSAEEETHPGVASHETEKQVKST